VQTIHPRCNAVSGRLRTGVLGALAGLLLLPLLVAVADAQAVPVTNVFGQPNSFGIGPRAMGMGGAFVAVADDASAAYWNVAGLAQLSSYEISLSSAPVYFDSNVTPP
jgi:hypothetical protein